MSTALAVASDTELLAQVRQILAASEDTLTATGILNEFPKGPNRPPLPVLQEVLDKAVAAGQIHAYPEVRGKSAYWDRPRTEYARIRIQRVLLKGPQTKSEIVNSVKGLAMLRGFSKADLERAFEWVVENAGVHRLEAWLGGRTRLFSLQPAQPRDYLERAIAGIAKKLGISKEATYAAAATLAQENVPAAPSAPFSTTEAPDSPTVEAMTPVPEPALSSEPPDSSAPALSSPTPPAESLPVDEPPQEPEDDLGERLLLGIAEVNPRTLHGDVVGVDELRKRFSFQLDKPTFDRELLKLAIQQRISLHRSDRPGLLTEEQREEQLVRDDAGNYYNTISLPSQA